MRGGAGGFAVVLACGERWSPPPLSAETLVWPAQEQKDTLGLSGSPKDYFYTNQSGACALCAVACAPHARGRVRGVAVCAWVLCARARRGHAIESRP